MEFQLLCFITGGHIYLYIYITVYIEYTYNVITVVSFLRQNCITMYSPNNYPIIDGDNWDLKIIGILGIAYTFSDDKTT